MVVLSPILIVCYCPLGRRNRVFQYKLYGKWFSSLSTKCQQLLCSPFPSLIRVHFSFFCAWFSFSDSSSLLLSVQSSRPNLKHLWAPLECFSGILASKDSETIAYPCSLAIETDFTTSTTGPSTAIAAFQLLCLTLWTDVPLPLAVAARNPAV